MKARDMLRQEAKRIYKENIKKVPKKNRLPFAEFFKQYKKARMAKNTDQHLNDHQSEDFDINELVNVNNISNNDKI